MINIIVAFPKMENAKNIKSILVKNGFRVNAVCTSGAQVLQHADMLEEGIIVCAGRLQDMMYIQLREYLSPHFQMLVVASAGLWEAEKSENVVSLTMPLKVHELVGTLEMMANSLMRRRRKKGRPAGRSEEEKQMIQKAKEVLMARNNMTEEEAHRYMQKSSMDSATNLAETAQMILSIFR
ncbi:MAG: ANTAR domain-containing protein [Lachnospiraceae bacterium]|nr:ANTAR domain-containing protein [Lachnospiraceae bacterium]